MNPGKGYYVKLTKTVTGPVGANSENLDSGCNSNTLVAHPPAIYAESPTFEVKPAGSKLTFPKGFGSGASRSTTLASGGLLAAAAAAVVAVLL